MRNTLVLFFMMWLGLGISATAQEGISQIAYITFGAPAVKSSVAPALAMSNNVDTDIPVTDVKNFRTFVLIVANESYMALSKVDFALNDSKVFKEYCQKTLGIPERNIIYKTNATHGMMRKAMDDMKSIAEACHGNCRFIVYYAGHGAPDESSKEAYLMGTDAYGVDRYTCYPLGDFYKDLSALQAKSVVVFMDACFSGATRSESGKMLASARGVAIVAKKNVPTGKVVVFSAASKDETAMPYREQQHGMFTYYLLLKLKESKGNVTCGDLADYLQDNVALNSLLVNKKKQNPNIIVGSDLLNNWKNLPLY